MENDKENLHEGHRERMYKRFEQEGFGSFEPHQVLEYILFFSIPRKDTNELAHRLLNHFGSFANVMRASQQELMEVKGIGLSTARLITMIMEAGRYYQKSVADVPKMFQSLDQIGDALAPYFYGARCELVYALFLDDQNGVIQLDEVARGSVNEAAFSKRELIRQAVRLGATQLVLAHNHPMGLALPSGADLQFTRELAGMLDHVGVTFLDHIIFDKEGDRISLRQSGRSEYLVPAIEERKRWIMSQPTQEKNENG